MKRVGHLLARIAEPDNLREAYLRAARGKRDRRDVIEFGCGLEERLREMRDQLLEGTVPLGGYRQFTVHDPKDRVITVAPFAQRVLHHAVMGVCEPYFERRLIDHCYACRKGKGRLAALETARRHCRRLPYFLKLDIRKYFDSVDHSRLVCDLHRLSKDTALLRLLEGIVNSFETAPGCGLPIGNLTSQHFANLYLGPLDRHVLVRSAPGGGGPG